MSYNSLINLRVIGRGEWFFSWAVLSALIMLSAPLSSHPVLLCVLALIILGVGWTVYTLGIYNINKGELNLSLFPDGRIQLTDANAEVEEGVLGDKQWCIQKVAVLQVLINGQRRHLVILSTQQRVADDFRRLIMRLRQGAYKNNRDQQVSGV